jgi:hypothetical protein
LLSPAAGAHAAQCRREADAGTQQIWQAGAAPRRGRRFCCQAQPAQDSVPIQVRYHPCCNTCTQCSSKARATVLRAQLCMSATTLCTFGCETEPMLTLRHAACLQGCGGRRQRRRYCHRRIFRLLRRSHQPACAAQRPQARPGCICGGRCSRSRRLSGQGSPGRVHQVRNFDVTATMLQAVWSSACRRIPMHVLQHHVSAECECLTISLISAS